MNQQRPSFALTPGQRIHLIGIGGAGLSAIARILLQRGFTVSGSDANTSPITAALEADGATVYHGHQAQSVAGADIVLASSAIPAQHVEIRAARSLGIPVLNRQAFLGPLLEGHRVIAVAGAHGKTTTTSMATHILRHAGQDPSYIVGGIMSSTGDNASLGAGEAFIIEADEYDNMFLGLRPDIAAVTNVEHDHPDFFQTAQQQRDAFSAFVDLLPASGPLIACGDDDGAASLLYNRRARGLPAMSYGLANENDWHASRLRHVDGGTSAIISHAGQELGELTLTVPGAHNMQNALAAIIIAETQGLTFQQSATALREFKNTARRFEIRGQRNGLIIIDDYAHHPTEIRVNIRAARYHYPEHHICTIWQPHTYSRIQQFWPDFLSAFDQADQVLITPIYAARENPIPGISGESLAHAINEHTKARFTPTFAEAAMLLRNEIRGPALALICSAGDANRIADLVLQPNEAER